MINSKIIKIASDTKYFGLKNKFTYKSLAKNSLCGDKIIIELIINKLKITTMRYETESCIYCEASASLLANKIKKLKIYTVIKELTLLRKLIKEEKLTFPSHFRDFKILINKKNSNRINCINLPFDAVLKALS